MLVRNSYGQAIQFHIAASCKMENVFMSVGEVSRAVYGFNMSYIDIFGESMVVSVTRPINGNGFDPMDGVL